MPRNATGTYTAPAGSWNPATNTNNATSNDWNTLLNDLVNAVTASIANNGVTPIQADMPMAGHKFTGLGAGTDPNDSVRLAQLGSYQPLDAGLTALAALTGAGYVEATGTDTYALVDAAGLKNAMSLSNVENKSSATIRSEITSGNVTTALGFTPPSNHITVSSSDPSGGSDNDLWFKY